MFELTVDQIDQVSGASEKDVQTVALFTGVGAAGGAVAGATVGAEVGVALGPVGFVAGAAVGAVAGALVAGFLNHGW